jgi:hydroxymethylpyrimidine pyrophosphatase-like HAD family hydrolase
VEHSIGMGQSSQAVKEIASYITDDVMEGGIYNAMKHFNLI